MKNYIELKIAVFKGNVKMSNNKFYRKPAIEIT